MEVTKRNKNNNNNKEVGNFIMIGGSIFEIGMAALIITQYDPNVKYYLILNKTNKVSNLIMMCATR